MAEAMLLAAPVHGQEGSLIFWAKRHRDGMGISFVSVGTGIPGGRGPPGRGITPLQKGLDNAGEKSGTSVSRFGLHSGL